MDNLNIGAYDSAMAGYKPPQTAQASSGSSSPLSGILGTALNILPFVVPEIGIPARMALGALATGGSSAIEGKPQNVLQDIMGGVTDGLMGGALGRGAKAATEAVDSAAPALAGDTAKAAESAPIVPTETSPAKFTVDPSGNVTSADNPGVAPTNIDPETGQGHVNFNKNPVTGDISVDNNNTFTPPSNNSATPPESTITPPEKPVLNTTTQTSPTDTFTQVNAPPNSQLNPIQKEANGVRLNALKEQVQQGGSRLTQAQSNQVAQNLMNDGYNNLGAASRDANLVTGDTGILSNGVNDHINNAEANGVALNFGDYNDLAQNNINEAHTTGVLSPAQEKAAATTLNGVRTIVAGTTDPTDTAALTHVIPSNAIKAARELGDRAQTQFQIAQGRGPAADGATQLGNLYNKMGADIMDRAFGTTSGNAPISDANLDNMIAQVKNAKFENPTYQQNLINTLESGKGGNMSLQDLRHLQANHVGYSNAANPDEISNLTNGLMSAGLSRAGIANAVLKSTPGLTAKAKAAETVGKFFTPGGATTDSADAGAINNTGGKTMSPAGKTALLAGIMGALGLGSNALATSNQASQANAQLNNPQDQQTQNILNNSNDLQRYLGEEGAIRSVFAPTFDSNAAQAGTEGQALLNSANQNQAARTAAANLLTARSQMGQGGILGGILSMIPGTAENTYKQQAANAQAQLNALGIAGNAPSVAQSGGSIPALTSMAGNVGNF